MALHATVHSLRTDRNVRVLTAKERELVGACAEVLLPAGGAIPMSGLEAGVVGYFDNLVARSPALTRLMLRALLHFVEYSPWVYGPFKGRLTRLNHADRERVIRALMFSRIYLLRTAFLGLRTVLTVAYFGNQQVNTSIGNVANLAPFEPAEASA